MTSSQDEESNIEVVGDVFNIAGELIMHGVFSGTGQVEDGQLLVPALTGEVTTGETSLEMSWADVTIKLDSDVSADEYVEGLGYGTVTMSSQGQTQTLVIGIIAAATSDVPSDPEEAYAWEQSKEAEFLELFPDVSPHAMMPIQFTVSGIEPPTPPEPVPLFAPCPYGLTHYGAEPLVDSVEAQRMIDEAIADLPQYSAGSHISIDDHVISANGFQEPLAAGDHISISEGVISATGFQPVLTAGTNITISEQNVISAAGGGPERLDITLKNLASGSIEMNSAFRIYTLAASSVYQQFTPSTQPYQIASLKVPATPTTLQYTPWQGKSIQAASGKAVRLPFTDDGSVTHMPGAFQIAVMVGPDHWQRASAPVDVIPVDVKSVDNCVKDLIIKPHSNFNLEIGGDAVLEPSVPMGAILVVKATLSGAASKVYLHCELASTKIHAVQEFNTATGTTWIGSYQELCVSRVVAAYATVPSGHTASEYADVDVVLTGWEANGNMIIPVAAVRDPAAVLTNTNCVLTLAGWYADFK